MGVGDAFDVEEEEEEEAAPPPKKGRTSTALPTLEGPESLEAFLTKYKKACLSKRQAMKEVQDRLETEQCTSHKNLVCMCPFFLLVPSNKKGYNVSVNQGVTRKPWKRRWAT